MGSLPESSIDLIFADPPYNLQLSGELWRPNMTRVDAVDEEWDRFADFPAYDDFSKAWLVECRRVLKTDGTIWVIGTYHNIYRLGRIMQDIGFWILNDIVWIKTNPMPNFRGVRFTNAHESLIWAAKSQHSRHTFNHHAMKELNEGKQMRSDWILPICTGKERIRLDGRKAHPTQKPEALLTRVILASSDPGQVVLDPFFGTGTTGAIAKKYHRRWIGIEREEEYVRIANSRIQSQSVEPLPENTFHIKDQRRKATRVPFPRLIELGLVRPGQPLFFRRSREDVAIVQPDGQLGVGGFEGSIHQVGRHLTGGTACNGWDHWFFETGDNELEPIDLLRKQAREMMGDLD
jgi:modification methylase